MSSRLTVALLFGGRSGEHEVSLRSGASVAEALSLRHHVLPVLVDKGGRWLMQDSPVPQPSGGTPVFLVPSPDDLGRLLGEDFTVELQAVEPRVDPPPGTPHIADVVLRARRR